MIIRGVGEVDKADLSGTFALILRSLMWTRGCASRCTDAGWISDPLEPYSYPLLTELLCPGFPTPSAHPILRQ